MQGPQTDRSRGPATQVWFLILPECHMLDLSGPIQVFYEATELGAPYQLHYVGQQSSVESAQGPTISSLEPLPTSVHRDDLVIVAGMKSSTFDAAANVPVRWLNDAAATGATIVSICSGALALGHAGLLDGRQCTTHWELIDRLRHENPNAKVIANRLFVCDGNLVTSAGIVSGIDTALWLVERKHGPRTAAKVAHELVVYLRRDGDHGTESIYQDYRTHLHPGVHRVQDWLIAHPEHRPTGDELAVIAGMSPRNLSRVFRQATGITLKTFSTRLKLEFAETFLRSSDSTVESVAAQCGFADSRQLRRLWKQHYGHTPSAWIDQIRSQRTSQAQVNHPAMNEKQHV